MAAPVTGPFVEFPSFPFTDCFRQRYRQVAPFTDPLPYQFYRLYGCRVDSTPSGTTTVKQADYDPYNEPKASQIFIDCTNLAYERLRSKLGPSAGWAENLAQINKTRTSIVERSLQLASVASSIRRGRFGDAARALRTAVPSGVSNRKAAAQNFLEFEYGWKPLFKDIVDSVERLTGFPEVNIPLFGEARARDDSSSRSFSSDSSGSSFSSSVTNSSYTVRMGAVARIVNPNLFLANQLGVIDFALPWKLIPFSFVVDWFVNVEQTISSISDWYGVELLRPYTTRFAKGHRISHIRNYSYNFITGAMSDYLVRVHEREGVHMTRTAAISGPVLSMKPFKGFSLERGAQAISLILSTLGK